MTDDMIMVQWADLTGRGFSRHQPSGTTAPPEEFWSAAERLLDADLSQPPEGIKSTIGHPVWTLRRVRGLWCFAVQGRRGPFGVAGTCRFAFAPEGTTAHEAWTGGRALAAADHEPERVELDPAWFQDAVARLLAGLAFDQPALPIDADPVAAATVIAAVLPVVPERTASLWSWSTCMLQKPDRADRRVVAGHWPEEFRAGERSRAQTIDQIFRRGSISIEEARRQLHQQQHALQGFDALVNAAVTGRPLEPELLAAPSLMHLLVGLGHANRPATWHDVGAMIELPAGRQELLKMAKEVAEWAERRPDPALAALKAEKDPGLIKPLTQGLMRAQSQSPENLLDLPTATKPALTDWHETLAKYLVEAKSRSSELKTLLGKWTQSDLEAVHDWLLLLGLNPASEPVLFPPRARFVINQITSKRDYTEAAESEVLRSENPLGFLYSLVEQLDPTLLSGASVGRMIASAAPHPRRPNSDDLARVQEITAGLATARLRVRDANIVLFWIEQVLTELRRQKANVSVVRVAMYGALGALLDFEQVPPPDSSLMGLCRTIGADNRAAPRILQLLAPPVEPPPAPEPPPPAVARTEPLVMPSPRPTTVPPRPAMHRQEDQVTVPEPVAGRWSGVRHLVTRDRAIAGGVGLLVGVIGGAFVFGASDTPSTNPPAAPSPAAVASVADQPLAQHPVILEHPAAGAPVDAAQDAAKVLEQLPEAGKVRAVFIVVYPDPATPKTGGQRGSLLQQELKKNERLARVLYAGVVTGQVNEAHAAGTVEVTVVMEA